MMNDNSQGLLSTLKFRLDQIYKEFIDMGPSLKSGLTRISDLEKKSERLDNLESLHDEFSALEMRILILESSIKGKQDNLCSDFKNLRDQFNTLKDFVSLISESIHGVKMEVIGLKKTMSDFTKATESLHANAICQSKKDFVASIQDMQKKLEDYSLEAINADITSLTSFYQDIANRLQRYDENFRVLDKRLSNINLQFAKQHLAKKD